MTASTPEPPRGDPEDWVAVGRLGRPHGIRGEVTVELRTDDPDRRFAVGAHLLRAGAPPLVVAGTRWHNGRLLLALEGYADRTAAESLRDTVVLVDPALDPPLEDPDEFYDHQLVGLAAVLPDGSPLGTVAEVLHPPGADLLALTRADPGHEGEEVLVPFVAAVVPAVDIAAGRLVVDPPEGLLG